MKGDLKGKEEKPEGEEAIDIDFVPLAKKKKKKLEYEEKGENKKCHGEKERL